MKPHPDWDRPVNPRLICCPSCGKVVNDHHIGGGFVFLFCKAFRRAHGKRYRCHVLTQQVVWVFRDGDGLTYAVRVSKEAYKRLCAYEDQHGAMPAQDIIAQHVKEAA